MLNSLGFPNQGAQVIRKRLMRLQKDYCLGINIGPNKSTTPENMHKDYLNCYEKLSEFADFITINISSPNTPDLRKLHNEEFVIKIIDEITKSRDESKFKPKIFIKISTDESEKEYVDIISAVNKSKIDGLIVSNTSNNKKLKSILNVANKDGGISGKAIKEKSNKILKFVKSKLDKKKIIVAVGGVFDVDSYYEKLDLGADLVQMYTGFIYEGPNLIKRIVKNDNQKSSNS